MQSENLGTIFNHASMKRNNSFLYQQFPFSHNPGSY
jgi:hypothetical protein